MREISWQWGFLNGRIVAAPDDKGDDKWVGLSISGGLTVQKRDSKENELQMLVSN